MVALLAAVVVELFTSQGCSSCPPADALLSQIRHQPGVIALAYHVDYWDHLGWRDPFSSRRWSQRQMQYVGAMHLTSAYTPQAVVNGTAQLVGSSKVAMTKAIADASKKSAPGSVDVTASRSGNIITATVHANAPAGYDVMLAVFQNQVTTNIGAGENKGRAETEDAIVRHLQRVSSGTITLPVDPSWNDVGVAVFLQNRDTLAIGGAAVVAVK
jgi:hypothetical protein